MTSSNPTHKLAELFRSDLISAMKLPDSTPLEPGSFLTIREPWRTEWEVGVQVCVNPGQKPEPQSRVVEEPPGRSQDFELPPSKLNEEGPQYPMYDLDELDLNWMNTVNQKRKFRALAGPNGLAEDTLREALVTLETKCQQNMACAIATEENLGIEYDEQTVCDVCRDHESEESNEMIFCDSCNVCVHQACYGVASVPRGSWLCRVCASGEDNPECVICYNKGGALKRVRPGNTNWAHLSCALWIPEVRLGNVDKMEPITNIEAVPLSRWNLSCCLCKRKEGACVQCSHPSCVVAYHVTCGFSAGLIMKSRLDMVNNTVIHESFCPKHTALRCSQHHSPLKANAGLSRQPSQLIHLQESFYKYAEPQDLINSLKMAPKLAELIYNYWKLKRRSQHNRTLLSHLPIEASLESVKAELAGNAARCALRDDENFMKIIHIRQNLEKARNLIYMVQRRERLKKQLLYNQLHHWELEAQDLGSKHPEPESIRQTRSMTQRPADPPPRNEPEPHHNIDNHATPPSNNDTATLANHRLHPEGKDSKEPPPSSGDAMTRSKLVNGGHSLNGVVTQDSSTRVSKPQMEGLVMRTGRGPHLRYRPYAVSKATTEPS